MRPRVLIVEDEPAIADTICYALSTDGFDAIWHTTGAAALAEVRAGEPSLIILDVGLPDVNGFDLFKQLSQLTSAPVIFLTARADEVDRIVGLELGADDYISKPFSPRELTARVRAVLRRAPGGSGEAPHGPPIRLRGFSLDPARREVRVRGRRVDLTPREFRLLETLARSPGRAFTREELVARAFGPEYEGLDRTIDAHVVNLRRKLESDPASPRFIQTVFGVGYRFASGRDDA